MSSIGDDSVRSAVSQVVSTVFEQKRVSWME